MRIGIDIDGVLTNLDEYVMNYLSKYCVKNNIEYSIENFNYKHFKTFNILEDQENDFWNENLESYAKNEIARPFASEVIKRLREEGNEIYILTARWLSNREDSVGENMRNIVKVWLNENSIDYDQLIFSKASKEKKIQEILDYKIDIMIEDSPSNIYEISKKIPVICYDSKYNKECEGNNIIRCYSWYDIYNKINIIKKENN